MTVWACYCLGSSISCLLRHSTLSDHFAYEKGHSRLSLVRNHATDFSLHLLLLGFGIVRLGSRGYLDCYLSTVVSVQRGSSDRYGFEGRHILKFLATNGAPLADQSLLSTYRWLRYIDRAEAYDIARSCGLRSSRTSTEVLSWSHHYHGRLAICTLVGNISWLPIPIHNPLNTSKFFFVICSPHRFTNFFWHGTAGGLV